MAKKIQKWGNSLGVRIPKNVAEQLGLFDGADVNIITKDGRIVIEPLKKNYDLKKLMADVTDMNLHKVDEDLNEGQEVW